eukprot:1153635-Pelagomonas_calceolata.AAC.2
MNLAATCVTSCLEGLSRGSLVHWNNWRGSAKLPQHRMLRHTIGIPGLKERQTETELDRARDVALTKIRGGATKLKKCNIDKDKRQCDRASDAALTKIRDSAAELRQCDRASDAALTKIRGSATKICDAA